jgi:hypothetical protein
MDADAIWKDRPIFPPSFKRFFRMSTTMLDVKVQHCFLLTEPVHQIIVERLLSTLK